MVMGQRGPPSLSGGENDIRRTSSSMLVEKSAISERRIRASPRIVRRLWAGVGAPGSISRITSSAHSGGNAQSELRGPRGSLRRTFRIEVRGNRARTAEGIAPLFETESPEGDVRDAPNFLPGSAAHVVSPWECAKAGDSFLRDQMLAYETGLRGPNRHEARTRRAAKNAGSAETGAHAVE